MKQPSHVDYPIIAIGDLHGQLGELQRLIARLERIPEWDACGLVFLGDFVDRGEDVPGTIERVIRLLERRAGGSAVMGNHDLGLVRAARLDEGPADPYWIKHYRGYDGAEATFRHYLGKSSSWEEERWLGDLEALRAAMPRDHRAFLSGLAWVVEAPGHLFLHCGLSPHLRASAREQVEALHKKEWMRETLQPRPGSATDVKWEPTYPVWLGADRDLSGTPLAHPSKVQVTGHAHVLKPEVKRECIRLDTSGGQGPLAACLLRAADAKPEFFSSDGRGPIPGQE